MHVWETYVTVTTSWLAGCRVVRDLESPLGNANFLRGAKVTRKLNLRFLCLD